MFFMIKSSNLLVNFSNDYDYFIAFKKINHKMFVY